MAKEKETMHGLESPAGYHAITPPSKHELSAPVKIYPGASKLGHDRGPKDMIEGPCDLAGKTGLYHKK